MRDEDIAKAATLLPIAKVAAGALLRAPGADVSEALEPYGRFKAKVRRQIAGVR